MTTEPDEHLERSGVGDTLHGGDAVERATASSSPVPVHDPTRPPADPTLDVVRPEVARVARDLRDPRMQDLVFSRLFADEASPPKIGRFAVLERLGAGGMGVVYAAYDGELDRKVAVKVLRSWRGGSDRDGRGHERLQREARAMARLSHPNIVTVHEVGTEGDEIYVAMEYIRGQSLDRWLEGPADGPPGRPWREVLSVFRAAGQGLQAAHRAGIVHRDFKPHNVMLGDDGAVKVLDFGLARRIGSSPVAHDAGSGGEALRSGTQTGMLAGTPAYMAPELHDGRPADERSDQFGFFASLYHALHRQRPFAGTSIAQIVESVTEGRVRPPPEDSTVPRWLHRAVLRGLQVDPAARYPSMVAAVNAIDRDPAARRRRALMLVGACVITAGIGAAAVAGLSPAPAPAVPCDQGHRAIVEVWGSSARAGLEQGLAASGLSFAAATRERLLPRLDAYATGWALARDQACVAHRDGTQSAALYDRRVACLEHRRAAFESLVGLLQQPDPTAVERALPAAAALPDLARCDDVDALLLEVRPPEDPQVAEQVEALRRRLARAGEQEALGQYAAGLEQVREIVAAAEHLGYPPLRAEALNRLGSLTIESGRPADAERMLTEALTHAMASGHTEAATEAVARRIFVRAERMRAPERATDDVALGAGLIERLPAAPALRGLYLNNVGSYHIRRQEYDAARQVLHHALHTKRHELGPDDPEIAYTLGNLALVEELQGHSDQARAHLDEAIELVQTTLGPQHPMTAELAQVRAELLFRTGHLEEARIELEGVLGILQQTVGPVAPLHHGPLTMLGEIALEQRRYADALEWFQRAARLEHPDDGSGTAVRLIEQAGEGRARVGLGEAAGGWAMLRQAAVDAERARLPFASSLRVLLGSTLVLHGRPEAALTELEHAEATEVTEGRRPSRVVADARLHRGRALRQLGRLDEADAILRAAVSELDALDGHHHRERGAALVERAWVALAKDQRDDAVTLARAALAALTPWGEPRHVDRARAWQVLAQALRTGSPTPAQRREAQQLARRAQEAFDALGAPFDRERLAPPPID